MRRQLATALLVLAVIPEGAAAAASDARAPKTVIRLVTRIKRADYEGDRPELKRLFDKLAPYADDKTIGSRVRYWRGFAMWRRALNGFNDSVDPKELEADLNQAVYEFDTSVEANPGAVESKIGAISCLGNIMYLNRENPARIQEIVPRVLALLKEAKTAAPENPRLLWVMGPMIWNRPSQPGRGPAEAIANYEKALDLIRARGHAPADPLDPSWGEPELLMNLAWSQLNQPDPDVAAAERNARGSIEMVPYWHYVRDILLPQILEAKAKSAAAPAVGG